MTPTADRRPGDRGVSEAVGFVLVFSLIILSVGFIYVGGFQSLQDLQRGEQLQNAERAFETLSANFEDLQQRDGPSRASEVDLNGGQLTVRPGANVTINVSNATAEVFNATIPARALSYRLGSTFVEYEGGATFRRVADGGASIPIRDPLFRCTDDAAIVSVVTLAGTDGSVAGTGSVTVTGVREESRLLFPEDRPADPVTEVNVSFDSPNEGGWNRSLDAAEGWSELPDGSYACSGVEQVFVRQVVVTITLRS